MIATACRNRTRLIEHSPRKQKGNCITAVSLNFLLLFNFKQSRADGFVPHLCLFFQAAEFFFVGAGAAETGLVLFIHMDAAPFVFVIADDPF